MLGIGGVNPDDPKYQDYAKRHMEVTGQEPDRWASPVTYASLEMLQQAIERVGKIDRAAIIKEIQTGTFDTVAGKIKLDKNVNTKVWWAGQWQNGEFYGLAPASMGAPRADRAEAGLEGRAVAVTVAGVQTWTTSASFEARSPAIEHLRMRGWCSATAARHGDSFPC